MLYSKRRKNLRCYHRSYIGGSHSKRSSGRSRYSKKSKTKATSLLKTLVRPPKLHNLEWNEVPELTPRQRATLADCTDKIKDLQNYDIVQNIREYNEDDDEGNIGKYIYKENGLYPLLGYDAMEHKLPEWVEIRKEDCGRSYFTDELIENDIKVPFQLNRWKPTKAYEKDGNIYFDLIRKIDGAKAIVNCIMHYNGEFLSENSLKGVNDKLEEIFQNSILYAQYNRSTIPKIYRQVVDKYRSTNVCDNKWRFSSIYLEHNLRGPSCTFAVDLNDISRNLEYACIYGRTYISI
jgi:hypothetical protein